MIAITIKWLDYNWLPSPGIYWLRLHRGWLNGFVLLEAIVFLACILLLWLGCLFAAHVLNENGALLLIEKLHVGMVGLGHVVNELAGRLFEREAKGTFEGHWMVELVEFEWRLLWLVLRGGQRLGGDLWEWGGAGGERWEGAGRRQTVVFVLVQVEDLLEFGFFAQTLLEQAHAGGEGLALEGLQVLLGVEFGDGFEAAGRWRGARGFWVIFLVLVVAAVVVVLVAVVENRCHSGRWGCWIQNIRLFEHLSKMLAVVCVCV